MDQHVPRARRVDKFRFPCVNVSMGINNKELINVLLVMLSNVLNVSIISINVRNVNHLKYLIISRKIVKTNAHLDNINNNLLFAANVLYNAKDVTKHNVFIVLMNFG